MSPGRFVSSVRKSSGKSADIKIPGSFFYASLLLFPQISPTFAPPSARRLTRRSLGSYPDVHSVAISTIT